jgi:hypothetical protein
MGYVPTNCSSNIKSQNVESKCDIKDGKKKKKKNIEKCVHMFWKRS